MALLLTTAKGQNVISFNGQVKDSVSGVFIAGATVKIEGTAARSVQTDSLGRFALQLPIGNYTLSVSYINYLNYSSKISVKA
ncbi:MAG TPA: carboxypeptidase regulatory-like domain-containing protein, partial [Niabella sp.]|nr:carboxypeptidase regulatory-like domain-containing protein [Niabella sp.]